MDISKSITGFVNILNLLKRSPETIKGYVPPVEAYLMHFNRNPRTITKDEAIEYLGNLKVYSSRTAIAAVKLFHKHCLNSDKLERLPYPKIPQHSTEIFSIEEIRKLIEATTNVKHRTIITLLYTTGMRVMECINLKWDCVDRATMRIHIKDGKGNKDRIVPLTPKMKDQFLIYCKAKKLTCFSTHDYVFKGPKEKGQYTRRSVENFIKKWALVAGLKKRITPHILRHSMATHLMEAKTDVLLIKRQLGHSSLKTTEIYTRSSNLSIPELL